MKKSNKILLLVAAALLLATAFVGVSAGRASAHNYDDASYLFCSAHKIPGTLVDHSWPVAIVNNWIFETCMIHDPYTGAQSCYRVRWHYGNSDGYPHGYSERITSYYANCPWYPHQP